LRIQQTRGPEPANISSLYYSHSKHTRIRYPYFNTRRLMQALGDQNHEFQTSFKMNTLIARNDMFNASNRHQTFERQITLPNVSNTDVLRRIAQLEERLFNTSERIPVPNGNNSVVKRDDSSNGGETNIDSSNDVVQELLDIVQKETDEANGLEAEDVAVYQGENEGYSKRIKAVLKNSKTNGAFTLSSIDSWVLQKELDETTEEYQTQVSMLPNAESSSASSNKVIVQQVYGEIPIRRRLRESWKRDERLRASRNEQQREDSLNEETRLPSSEEFLHVDSLEKDIELLPENELVQTDFGEENQPIYDFKAEYDMEETSPVYVVGLNNPPVQLLPRKTDVLFAPR